jgi:lipopolysaccharide transport protein LptA
MTSCKFQHAPLFLLLSLLAGLPCIATAAPVTQDELHINADSFDLNRQAGVTTFVGHVRLDQGATHLVADKLEIKSTNNQVTKTTAFGDLAHYWTTPTANPKKTATTAQKQPANINAVAKTIEYYPQTRKIFLIGKASATQDNNTIKSPRIEYDVDSGHLVSTASPEGRTFIVIQNNKFNLLSAKKNG